MHTPNRRQLEKVTMHHSPEIFKRSERLRTTVPFALAALDVRCILHDHPFLLRALLLFASLTGRRALLGLEFVRR